MLKYPILLLILLFTCLSTKFSHSILEPSFSSALTHHQLTHLLTLPIIILDIRPISQLQAGILPNSLLIEYDEDLPKWFQIFMEKSQPYIIYGDEKAVEGTKKWLKERGFTKGIGWFFGVEDKQNGKGKEQKVKDFVQDFRKEVKDNGRKIVDVRTKQEWRDGVVNGAALIQLKDLKNNCEKLLNKKEKYILYCRSGYRARIGYSFLKNQGYDVRVYVYGGFKQLKQMGMPVRLPTYQQLK